ncbi:MAG: GAF domain-containing protein [Ignavibacteriales bacterium]|jgi:Nif-specific regulatory protein|nr:MAG: GAF domain-containing protein [Ignavibacteriales bacterium]
MEISEQRHNVNKLLSEFVSQSSTRFLNLSSDIKKAANDPELLKQIDKTFKSILEFNRVLTKELDGLFYQYDKLENKLEKLSSEKKKLERLYASGILFQSETEMKRLMEKAIDTVVTELNADEGFIVLVDEKLSIDTIVAKNMEPENEPEAKELSTTIINDTIKNLRPSQLSELQVNSSFGSKHSIVSLGLKAALCVPLVSNSKVMGAVYLDRRNAEMPFKESDLTFLLSFANQIVKGIEVSKEIDTLEEKLANVPSTSFKELREEFKSNNIIGSSRKLYDVLNLASKVSDTDVSILLLGENGTGKDLLAQAIHNNSKRRDKPFVAVNCGAIPSDLLESELFGFESGAFTGANKSKPGRLESADGGTVFLDEIGEMSVNLQAKLLRVIQTREIERLGSVNSKKIDVRFIAATNQDISKMIEEKRFREDLYYRLKVIEIYIPPLRERKEDVEDLVQYFLNKYAKENKAHSIADEAIEILESYNWPGNIRELENVIQRAVILCPDKEISSKNLPAEIVDDSEIDSKRTEDRTLSEAESEFRKRFIMRVLRKTESKSEAAKILGINRSHLHKLLTQLDINL